MHSGEPDPIFPAPRRPRKGPEKLARCARPSVVRVNAWATGPEARPRSSSSSSPSSCRWPRCSRGGSVCPVRPWVRALRACDDKATSSTAPAGRARPRGSAFGERTLGGLGLSVILTGLRRPSVRRPRAVADHRLPFGVVWVDFDHRIWTAPLVPAAASPRWHPSASARAEPKTSVGIGTST
jgi:hypothetical protein